MKTTYLYVIDTYVIRQIIEYCFNDIFSDNGNGTYK